VSYADDYRKFEESCYLADRKIALYDKMLQWLRTAPRDDFQMYSCECEQCDEYGNTLKEILDEAREIENEQTR
jgi:hypothetical protein